MFVAIGNVLKIDTRDGRYITRIYGMRQPERS